jgi:hypothetical protein
MWRCERILTTLLLIGFTVPACAQTSVAEETVSSTPVLIVCEDPRPQMCTMQYDPVCGVTGGSQRKTYSNACSACSDAKVSGYSSGTCE